MDKWQTIFEEAIGMAFPDEMLPEIPLKQVFENHSLMGSPPAVANPLLDQGSIEEFLESAPDGYMLIGFWGHGVNSYAFYYVVADSWRKVFLRLPYGGAYSDNEKLAALIRQFLPSYLDFEKRLRGKAQSLVAVESMGIGHYKLVLKDGQSVEHEGPMLWEPHFADKLG